MRDHHGQDAAEAPLFHALLTPYRSLSPRGFNVVMAIFGFASLLSGVIFLAKGAWPVVGFFGLDVFALWLAFRLNYRQGRAQEEVTVSRLELSIRKTSPKGVMRESRFNPFWTRFLVQRHREAGVTHMTVTGQGHTTEIGSFLNPDDRESFAKAFGEALARAKRG